MSPEVMIQLIITAGASIGAMFLTIRYAINKTNEGKDSFLQFLDKMQTQQLEYYENKNGHLERISNIFAKTVNKNTSAIEKLTGELKGDTGRTGARGRTGRPGKDKK